MTACVRDAEGAFDRDDHLLLLIRGKLGHRLGDLLETAREHSLDASPRSKGDNEVQPQTAFDNRQERRQRNIARPSLDLADIFPNYAGTSAELILSVTCFDTPLTNQLADSAQ